MNIDEVKQLRRLSESFIQMEDFGFESNPFTEDENVKKYKEYKSLVESEISKKIELNSEQIFSSINIRDFNIHSVKREMESLAFQHWTNRSPEEAEVDRLMDFDYNFYVQSYIKQKNFKELLKLNIEREEFKDYLLEKLTKIFQKQAIERIRSGVSTKVEEYCNHIYATRDLKEKERDRYGLIELSDYKKFMRKAYNNAWEEMQKEIRTEVSNKVENYVRKIVAERGYQSFDFEMGSEILKFITALFDNRSEERELEEERLIINFYKYKYWAEQVVTKVKNEVYPENQDGEYLPTESDEFQEYESGYDKYGGYNEYDDDTIDNAFDGDPSNTWNVD